jgi:rubrerythrin
MPELSERGNSGFLYVGFAMKAFSVEEIIHYSQKVEQESYSFYKEAENRISGQDVLPLLRELQEAEIEHLNKLRTLLKEKKLSQEELDTKLDLEIDPQQMLVSLEPMPEDPTPTMVLQTALKREKNTEALYRQLLAFTDISEDVVSTFNYLVSQEKGHVITIENKLERL